MRKRISLLQMAVFFFTAQVAWAGNIKTEKVTLVGNGIVEFIPVGYDVSRTPSLILSHEPEKKGEVPENWKLVPQFTMTDGKANASLDVPAGTSLYGGGEVTGPLLRNGQKIRIMVCIGLMVAHVCIKRIRGYWVFVRTGQHLAYCLIVFGRLN